MTSASTSPPLPPVLGSAGELCRHCGAELAPDQRYCLNCGLRRAAPRVEYRELLLGAPVPDADSPPTPAPAPTPSPPAPGAGDVRTVSPLGAAVAIGLLLLATLLGAIIGQGSGDAPARPVVVGGAPTAAAAAVTSEWTAGEAWTVQLQAFPAGTTTPQQMQQAKRAAEAKGASDVGVLVSDDFAGLPGGQYLLYSGSQATKAAAERALAGLRRSFPDAVVIRVSTTSAAAGSDAAGAAKEKRSSGSAGSSGAPADVQRLEKSTSTKDYVNKSKKLPDKVGTGGSAPPTDDKAPGGDSGGGTTIG